MTEELRKELKEYLKENLQIVGDYHCYDFDGKSITIQVVLEDELITEESFYLY